MIERKSGQSLWRQIANNISDAIRSGTYPPGSKLPTEAELSQQYGVNRHTLRRAVSELAEAGVIRVEQGRGSFVQEHVLDYLVAKKTRFSDNVLRQRRTPGGRTLLLTEEVGDPPGNPCDRPDAGCGGCRPPAATAQPAGAGDRVHQCGPDRDAH